MRNAKAEVKPRSCNRSARLRWILCDCEAGLIGAPHCRKCNGKGFTAIVKVTEPVTVTHPLCRSWSGSE